MMGALWRRLASVGTEGLSFETRRKVRALNQFTLIAASSLVAYAGLLLVVAPELTQVVWLDIAAVVIHLTAYWHVRAGRRLFAVGQFLFVNNVHLAAVSYIAGTEFGFHFYYLAFVPVVFLVSTKKEWFHYPWTVFAVVAFLYFSQVPAGESTDVARAFSLLTILATCFTLALVAFLFDADVRKAEAALSEEHARSERLLQTRRVAWNPMVWLGVCTSAPRPQNW